MVTDASGVATRKENPPAMEEVRAAILAVLVATVPLGSAMGWTFEKVSKTDLRLAAFDILVWLALAFVATRAVRSDGWRGLLRLCSRVPLPGAVIVLAGVWSGLLWPRLSGGGDTAPGLGGFAGKMVPLVEYVIVAFVVFGELLEGEGPRRLALRVLAAMTGLALLVGLWQYFSSRSLFDVGGTVENCSAWGAFLAMAVPFFGTMALCGCRKWRLAGGAIAVCGAVQLLTLGAVLAVGAGLLLAASACGWRRSAAAAAALAVVLGLGQLLPRHTLSAAVESARVEKNCPKTGQRLVAMRYVRAAAELNVLRAPFRASSPERRLFFGFGPGGYKQSRRFLPGFATREAGETGKPENFDTLSDEPGTFNMFGVAAVEMGWPGLLGFVWLAAFCIGACIARLRECASGGIERTVAIAVLAAIVGGLIVSPFASIMVKGSGPMLGLMLALLSSGSASSSAKQA